MAGGDEDLLGDHVLAIGDEQGDVTGDLVLFVRDEHDVALESLEDSAVIPTRGVRKNRLREPEEPAELALTERRDIECARHGR